MMLSRIRHSEIVVNHFWRFFEERVHDATYQWRNTNETKIRVRLNLDGTGH